MSWELRGNSDEGSFHGEIKGETGAFAAVQVGTSEALVVGSCALWGRQASLLSFKHLIERQFPSGFKNDVW